MEFDYLIVGGGSAGCVLANRLSARSANRVALIEAGPDTPPGGVPETVFGEGYLPDYFQPNRYWTDLKVYRDPIGNRSLAEIERDMIPARYEQARVMGGGSSVNAQVSLRGVPSDYDEWEAYGAAGWSWADCLPYFRKLERDMDFDGDLHGREGPIMIARAFPESWGGFALAFRDAMEARGVPYADDAHAVEGDGCFPFPRNNIHGRRVSAAVAYLDTNTRRRPNLTIFPETMVEHLEFEGRRAVAAHVACEGGRRRIGAREIIVSSGAIHSPAMLMRAGIGPAHHLADLGIEMRVDLPGVGSNLQDHPLVGLGLHLKPEARLNPGTKNGFLLYARFSSGMGGCPRQDMKLSLANRLDASAVGHQFGVIRVGPDKAYSSGFVRLRTPSGADEPIVAFNLLSDPRDMERMIAGVKFVYGALTTPPVADAVHSVFAGAYTSWIRWLSSPGWANRAAAAVGAALLDSGPIARRAALGLAMSRYDVHGMMKDDAAIEAWVRETVLGNWHACGSCRMGSEKDRMAVVDRVGRVYGTAGLRVCDASIMPTVPCANTNLSTIMIAEKISAAMIAEPA